jgi:hypothetical protein
VWLVINTQDFSSLRAPHWRKSRSSPSSSHWRRYLTQSVARVVRVTRGAHIEHLQVDEEKTFWVAVSKIVTLLFVSRLVYSQYFFLEMFNSFVISLHCSVHISFETVFQVILWRQQNKRLVKAVRGQPTALWDEWRYHSKCPHVRIRVAGNVVPNVCSIL